ncbi:periplasmic heavy metal sensor [bacterium]|nr:periplasmic heavy metal sensor [bacterium]
MKPALREIILWLSIGLNVALITGMALGPCGLSLWGHRDPFVGGPPFPPEASMLADLIDLNGEQEKEIEVIFAQARKDAIPTLNEMRARRLRLLRFVIESPEDLEGRRRLLDEDGDIPRRMIEPMLGHLSSAVKVLTPEQRRDLLHEIEEMDKREGELINKGD